MKAFKILAAVALAAVVFTGCSKSNRQKTVTTDMKLTDIVWHLTEMDGQTVDKADKYEVSFLTNGRIAGIGECNRFFGQYEIINAQGGIKMGPVGSTMMACLGENRESEYFQTFETITLYQFDGKTLYLFNGSEPKAKMIFTATDKTVVTGE